MFENQTEFTVTLLSNASYNVYPQNNVYKFTNILAKPLFFPPQEKWRVCLQSITLSTTSDDPNYSRVKKAIRNSSKGFQQRLTKARKAAVLYKTPEKIKAVKTILEDGKELLNSRIYVFNNTNCIFVNCGQIIPKYGSERNISSFIIPPKELRKGDSFTYEPLTEEYFNLATNEISEFDINITNSSGQIIYKTAAQPTIILLKFKKMADENETYTVNTFNDNESASDFHVKFPPLFIKDGEQNPWEIAVSRISFIPLFNPFPSGSFSISIVKGAGDFLSNFTTSTWEEYLRGKEVGEMNFEYDQQATYQTFITLISNIIGNACKKVKLKGELTELKEDKVLSIKVSTTEGNEEKDETFLIILPEELIYVLGFDNDGIYYRNGYGAIPSNLKKKLKGRRKMNTNFLIPQNLLLYLDCVAPSLVGNIYGKYLTHVPIPNTERETLEIPYLSYEPKNLEFHPIIQNDVSRVRLQLLKADGSTPQFLFESIKTFVTFLLRRRAI